jgi:hypothetical protein
MISSMSASPCYPKGLPPHSLISLQIVIHISLRQGACYELASNTQAKAKFSKLYWSFMSSNTPSSVLLPWRRNTSKRMELLFQMNEMILGCVRDRIESGRREEDAVQGLIDGGDSADVVAKASL